MLIPYSCFLDWKETHLEVQPASDSFASSIWLAHYHTPRRMYLCSLHVRHADFPLSDAGADVGGNRLFKEVKGLPSTGFIVCGKAGGLWQQVRTRGQQVVQQILQQMGIVRGRETSQEVCEVTLIWARGFLSATILSALVPWWAALLTIGRIWSKRIWRLFLLGEEKHHIVSISSDVMPKKKCNQRAFFSPYEYGDQFRAHLPCVKIYLGSLEAARLVLPTSFPRWA